MKNRVTPSQVRRRERRKQARDLQNPNKQKQIFRFVKTSLYLISKTIEEIKTMIDDGVMYNYPVGATNQEEVMRDLAGEGNVLRTTGVSRTDYSAMTMVIKSRKESPETQDVEIEQETKITN